MERVRYPTDRGVLVELSMMMKEAHGPHQIHTKRLGKMNSSLTKRQKMKWSDRFRWEAMVVVRIAKIGAVRSTILAVFEGIESILVLVGLYEGAL